MPRHPNSLGDNVRHALYGMCKYRGGLRLHGIALEEVAANSDDPRVVVHVAVDGWVDAGAFCDWVHEALVFHLCPEYESQVEVEIVEDDDDADDGFLFDA